MNAKEFVSGYIMHDSIIDAIKVDQERKAITMMIDFAFWMQREYQEGNPETGPLAIIFHNVTEYECPEALPFGEISILKVSEEDGRIQFAILNDMTDDYYDLFIKAESIEVKVV